jgi:hypothetical protein
MLQLNHKFSKKQRRQHHGEAEGDEGKVKEGVRPGKRTKKGDVGVGAEGAAPAASDDEEGSGDDAAAVAAAAAVAKDDAEIWRRKPQLEERGGDEFDEFLMGIFR